MEPERRILTCQVEAREEGGRPKIVLYAAKFNTLSHDLGGFVETIRPGAFTRSLQSGPDVVALIDHDPARLLARKGSGTLTLREDADGLLAEIDPVDSDYTRTLLAQIRRGDVAGGSFAFNARKQEWRDDAGAITRELVDVDLYDVSAVTTPAYPDTSVAVRSFTLWRARQTLNESRLKMAELVGK